MDFNDLFRVRDFFGFQKKVLQLRERHPNLVDSHGLLRETGWGIIPDSGRLIARDWGRAERLWPVWFLGD